jgi:aspartyl-tRNA(Asn)/glutamyl-tRNA(Gln) amidotransferase subunit C
MSLISKDEVLLLAKMAQLHLGEDETESMTKQLQSLIRRFDKIREVKTEGVEPLHSVVTNHTVLRVDVVDRSLSVHEALANAPSPQDGYFNVPRIVE